MNYSLSTKQLNQILIGFVLLVTITSCSQNTDDETNTTSLLISKTITNLSAVQTSDRQGPPSQEGPFMKFSFNGEKQVSSESNTDSDWDIAFRATTILVNGGASITTSSDEPARTGNAGLYVVDALFDEVKTVDESRFKQDTETAYALPTGSGKGWYNYDATNNLIKPIPGKVIVIKTHDGKYAKIEIQSYYKDNPQNPTSTSESQYYTFKYVFQNQEGNKNFD